MGIKAILKKGLRSIIQMTKEEKLYPVPQPVNVQKILEGKVALITGGSGGIGMAMAEAFADAGCKVVIAGTNEDKLRSCVGKINRSEVRYIVINVLDIDSMPDIVEKAVNLFEEKRIDILVNSAGVVAHSSFDKMSEEEYDSIMDINAKGTFFMSQAVSKYMIEKNIKGHILNVTSSSALRPAWTPYQMSKWAIRGFTKGLADVLLPYGITVNAIAPGPVATEMLGKHEGDSIYSYEQPSKRYALPSEIAAMATFLVSDMCNLVVGDTIYMTGGSGVIDYKH